MDWIIGIQKAIDYIEINITEKLNYENIAAQAFVSSYHFQRVFSIMCGFTLGEYIRNRRLTLAGNEIVTSDMKIIDIALKYGYESPDSFSKAFFRFHGVVPSVVRKSGGQLKSFSRLSLKNSLEGGSSMKYRIEAKPAFSLVGYKTRFTGDVSERLEQERDFWVNTRSEQEELRLMRDAEENIWYDINTNFCDSGYDHYIAVPSQERLTQQFERIELSAATYVICETEKVKYPTRLHTDLRKQLVAEWLPTSGYQLSDLPEVVVTHWHKKPNDHERYIELWLPIEKL